MARRDGRAACGIASDEVYLGIPAAHETPWLAARLAQRHTPAHDLLARYRQTGLMIQPGGLLESARAEPVA